MKRIYYLSKLKAGKKEKDPTIKILIHAGTKIYVTKVLKYVPIITRKDLTVKVLIDDGKNYKFRLPKSEKLSYVPKGNVEVL